MLVWNSKKGWMCSRPFLQCTTDLSVLVVLSFLLKDLGNLVSRETLRDKKTIEITS